MAQKFHESELEVIGEYSLPGIYGGSDKIIPKFNRPITPRENLLRYLKGENPLWMPDMRRDCTTICPYIMPDSYARAFGGIDWFGIEWQYEPTVRAGMVKPGTRRLSDITKWETELQFPDLNAIDWEKDARETYGKGLSPDLSTSFVIVNGIFERTADLTSFEDAFCALLEEPEALTAFYNRLVDWIIELIGIAKRYYNADMILFHDDMGSQKSAFFSGPMFREMLMPHYQKITKAVHDLGMYISLHSCGNVGIHMQNFIDSGFDAWEGQSSANDKQALMDAYGDKLRQMSMTLITPDIGDQEAIETVHGLVDGIGKTRRFLPSLMVMGDRDISLEDELYRYSRIKYSESKK